MGREQKITLLNIGSFHRVSKSHQIIMILRQGSGEWAKAKGRIDKYTLYNDSLSW